MAETIDISTSRPHTPEEFRWCIAYLRENIQDLRNEIRYVNRRIDKFLDFTNQRIDERIDFTNQRIEETNRRSYGSNQTSNQYSDETFERLLRRLDIYTTVFIVMMFVLTGVAIAIIKL